MQTPHCPAPSTHQTTGHDRRDRGEPCTLTYPDNVLVDHNNADKHGHVGQHGEDGQDFEILDEREQHHERQEGKDV